MKVKCIRINERHTCTSKKLLRNDEVSRQNADISTKRRERSQNTNTHERQRRVNRTP